MSEMDLCRPCAELMREGYELKKTKGCVDNKITCAGCGKRRYGATCEILRKPKKS